VKRTRFAGLIALLLCSVLGPCVAAEAVLRRSAIGEVQTLDPQLWVYGQDGNIAQDLFHGLTTLDAAANVVPGSAASWVVSPDGRRYEFKLRPGLQWSDGVPISSADFLYSMRRLFDPKTRAPSAGILFVIRNARAVQRGEAPVLSLGVSAPDPSTVLIELEHPYPGFLDLLVHRAFPVPRHVLEKWVGDWTRAEHIVSNGPFVLAERRPNAYIKLKKNPRFYAADSVKLDAVMHIPIEDPRAALARYRAGELDVAVTLPSEMLDELRRTYGAQLRLTQQIGLEYYVFNTRRKPFDDERVRRALSMSIDREGLSRGVLRAREPAAYCLVPPNVNNYPQRGCADFASLALTARRTQARELLAQAGYGANKPLVLTLRYNNADTQRKTAIAVAAMWQTLGVRTNLVAADLRAHQQAVQSGDFDVARASWYAEDRDPTSFLDLLAKRSGPVNLSGFSDAEYDRLLDAARRTVALPERARLLRQAELRAMHAQPVAPLYYYVSRRLISPRVRGWVDNPRGIHLQRYLSLED
jgi:oligopeptide transport system substrate-binding protein